MHMFFRKLAQVCPLTLANRLIVHYLATATVFCSFCSAMFHCRFPISLIFVSIVLAAKLLDSLVHHLGFDEGGVFVSDWGSTAAWDPLVSAQRFPHLIRRLSYEFDLVRHIVSSNTVDNRREVVFGVATFGGDSVFNWIHYIEKAGYKNWLLAVRHQALFDEVEREFPGHTIVGSLIMDKLDLGKCGDEYEDGLDLEPNGGNFSDVIETIINYMLLKMGYIVIYAYIDVMFRGPMDLSHIMVIQTSPSPRTTILTTGLYRGLSVCCGSWHLVFLQTGGSLCCFPLSAP
eukprot:ANDGO_04716.mRNA.1 hypothetical protein